ncbi:hypothetical protein Y032_0120g916 [Ancylostoma ceylanicum]|uniref:Uncharacterized protein n=1 Tax=Ancylostoma ceylanicum TaxID=53326 RepID=A0A016TAT8_9BILA|nr:hypothetical protein Y032_0120g916 [Ancylostoma ceylanicum]
MALALGEQAQNWIERAEYSHSFAFSSRHWKFLGCSKNVSDRNLRGSRHRKTSQTSVTYRTNKSIRIIAGIVGMFVCTWYLSVVSKLIALSLDLPQEYLDYILTLIMIPTLIAYSQNFYALHACPAFAPVLRQQTAWLTKCGSKEGGNPAVQNTLRSSSSGVATLSTPNNSV